MITINWLTCFSDSPRETLGDLFDVGKKLGAGDYATVYSATRHSDNELVSCTHNIY